jgi:4-alpha-glucanotransferase
MTRDRVCGVLLHPTSFPGPHGIGDLGPAAFRFVEWLARAKQRRWQVMPLGPTGIGDSPYASPSAFAGNPLLISLEWLAGDGLLEPDDFAAMPDFHDWEVLFDQVAAFKWPLLRRAYHRFLAGRAPDEHEAFERFKVAESYWLDDYALFMACKSAYNNAPWSEWDEPLRKRTPAALTAARREYHDEIEFHQFVQFQFLRQWSEIKRYANEREILIIADIPIFVALDSADTWAHQKLFQLDADGRPTVVAGVPPDYFSPTGQLWGNPHYNWEEHAESRYRWWIDRVRAILQQVDIIRIDHFRAFAAAWAVPAGATTAESGNWVPGPGAAIFRAIRGNLGDVQFIAEDLGIITPDVTELRLEVGIPGMKVLQFAFGDDPDNPYLPHNYEHESVVYTATHDNQTTIGWFQSLDEPTRQDVQRYLGGDGSDIAWDLIRLALASVSDTAIVPLQDVMRLGDDARMNTPGRLGGNWTWRYAEHQLHDGLAAGLGEMTTIYGRQARPQVERGHDPYDYTAPHTEHPLQS